MSGCNSSENEWKECFSNKYKAPYWFNASTGESVWVNPNVNQIVSSRTTVESSASNSVSSPTTAIIHEDSPIVANERDKWAEKCLDILTNENTKYGDMRGHTKTARSCRQDGMKIGMYGIYARVIWSQLLNQVVTVGDVGSNVRDSIFPTSILRDQAVEKEFIDGGRTSEQAQDILHKLGQSLMEASASLVQLSSSTRSNLDTIRVELTIDTSHIAPSSNKRKLESISINPASPVTTIESNLVYSLQFGGVTHSISGSHFAKLLRLYRLHTDPNTAVNDPVFLRRAYCVIARYETLSGKTDGYQMAFPDPGFQWLRDRMGVKIECFASPLNCWNERICSVARDTDQFFGSLGNFFLFEGSTGKLTLDDEGAFKGGSFEANPPFVESVMNDMAKRIEYLLEKYKDYPFSVVVVVPAWTDCEGISIMCNSPHGRPHRGYKLTLEKKQHDYRPGMQHRSRHEAQPSNVDSFVFFLQNDKGAAKWPVTEKDAEELKRMLKETSV